MNTPPPRVSADYYFNSSIPVPSSDSDFSRSRRKKQLDSSPPSLRTFEDGPEGCLSSKDVDRQRRLDQERSMKKDIEKSVKTLDESEWLLAPTSCIYLHHYSQL